MDRSAGREGIASLAETTTASADLEHNSRPLSSASDVMPAAARSEEEHLAKNCVLAANTEPCSHHEFAAACAESRGCAACPASPKRHRFCQWQGCRAVTALGVQGATGCLMVLQGLCPGRRIVFLLASFWKRSTASSQNSCNAPGCDAASRRLPCVVAGAPEQALGSAVKAPSGQRDHAARHCGRREACRAPRGARRQHGRKNALAPWRLAAGV